MNLKFHLNFQLNWIAQSSAPVILSLKLINAPVRANGVLEIQDTGSPEFQVQGFPWLRAFPHWYMVILYDSLIALFDTENKISPARVFT